MKERTLKLGQSLIAYFKLHPFQAVIIIFAVSVGIVLVSAGYAVSQIPVGTILEIVTQLKK